MKKNNFKKMAIIIYFNIAGAFLISGCASHSRPNLYPNETLKHNGLEKANQDINECLKNAEDFFNTKEGKEAEKGTPVIGGFIGTSVGFGTGNTGMGIGVGVGSGQRVIDSSDIHKVYVNQCLFNKGYQVLSWH